MSFDIEHLDANRLLEQWRWLCTKSVTLIARSGFGDLFLRTVEGKVLCLNVGDGTLAEVAESESSFEDSLKDSAKREFWFAEQQLQAFADRGLKVNDLQCIGFKVPVVFGESANVPNNAYVADLYEQVSFLGDLHRQIADIPDVKAASASFGDDVDVEVVEAIVAVEVVPFERYLRRIAFNPNIRASFHWTRSIRGSGIPMIVEKSRLHSKPVPQTVRQRVRI